MHTSIPFFRKPAVKPSPERPALEGSLWRRGFDDLPREHGFEPLRIEGKVPDDLAGTYFWNGPGQFRPFGEHYGHWFDGDGAVGAVRFGGGQAAGAVKLVQTKRLTEERAAGRRLYSRLTRRSRRPVRELLGGDRPAGNVNVLLHEGRVFALGIGDATELRDTDLATLGDADLDGLDLRGFSAHPHYVAARRATYTFAQRMGKRTTLDVIELPDQGPARILATLPLAAPSLIHDCIATEKHMILAVPSLRFRVLPMLLNLTTRWDSVRFQPELPAEILVVPIDHPVRAVRISVPSFFSFHFANAFERSDGRIVVDMPRSESFDPDKEWLAGLALGEVRGAPTSRMHRLTIDPVARRASFELLDDALTEMPRVAPQVEASRHRFVYTVAFGAGRYGAPDAIRRLDVESGQGVTVRVGDERYPGEPVLAPRGPAEDDVYALTLVYDGRTHTSHVAIFDAKRLEAGPVGRVHFDHHVPFHFHGAFRP
jgi:all-trans-8'-apo-beta-carotenal 15,15'-oxygenase